MISDDAPSCRLYLITPDRLDPAAFRDDLAAALDAGDVACVQLRLKNVDDDAVRRAAEILRPVAHEREVAFLLNDRADLVAETGADGVHIGADDLPYREARALAGAERIVGVSCYDSTDRAMRVAEQGADYVAFGAFFPTKTKKPRGRPDADILESWSLATTVPCVAVGGITPENCPPLVRAGADFLAAISAVWDHPDGPANAVRAFDAAIESAAKG